MKEFAERLKELRLESHYSTGDVSAHLGIGRRAYQYYEEGQNYPDTPRMIKLADFFGVKIDYLLGRSDTRN